jgi:outer membrane lipoprotein-sorting protein
VRSLRKLLASAMCAGLALARMSAASPEEPLPRDIVLKADAIRFPQTDYEVSVAVTSIAAGHAPEVRRYQILSKGNDRTLVVTTEPPVDRGQVLLMREKDLWIYMPSLSQPLRLPLSQRLTGQVANGDLARSNFSGDYTPVISRTEDLAGVSYWVLELTAADKGMTYNRLLYWVNRSNFRPLKSEFYSLSGKVLKTCRYENYVDAGGARRPSRVVMEDALSAGAKSVLDYSNFQVKGLADKIFTKDYLKKLS